MLNDEPEAAYLARVLPFLPPGSWIEQATERRMAHLAGLEPPRRTGVAVRAGGTFPPRTTPEETP